MPSIEEGLVIINEGCRAACSHCPYGKVPQNFPKDLKSILDEIESSKSSLIILSGGEPLEYQSIHSLLKALENIHKLYRIATGGHVYLLPFLDQLKRSSTFTGFSIGTDILIPLRNNNKKFRHLWIRNLLLLYEHRVNYSITITLGSDMCLQNLLKSILVYQPSPDFFLLCEMENESVSGLQWEQFYREINLAFPKIPIKRGFFNENCDNILL